MPCDDSGSKREAASPTASHPSPATVSSRRDSAERAVIGPSAFFSSGAISGGIEDQTPRSRAMSASVMNAAKRRPPGGPGGDHQPAPPPSTGGGGSPPRTAKKTPQRTGGSSGRRG